jgi:formylmethanofuran dehydrogenase subunit E
MEEEKKKKKEERRRRTERIRKAPEPALRKALMTLCNRDPDIKNRILKCLDDLAAGPSRKRKAEDNIKCVRCKENFIDDDENYETPNCIILTTWLTTSE